MIQSFWGKKIADGQNGKNMRSAKVVGRASDRDGMPIGEFNENPILNTRVYDVMFPDGNIQEYSANVIIFMISDCWD